MVVEVTGHREEVVNKNMDSINEDSTSPGSRQNITTSQVKGFLYDYWQSKLSLSQFFQSSCFII